MSAETWSFWSPVVLLSGVLWIVLSYPRARGATRVLADALRLTLVLGLIGYTVLLFRADGTMGAYAVVFLALPGWVILSAGAVVVAVRRRSDRRRAAPERAPDGASSEGA